MARFMLGAPLLVPRVTRPYRRRRDVASWRFGMTVCVAAIASGGDEIIAAADSMMSWGAGITSDTSLKFERIHPRWGLMLAGDDVHPAEPIIRELRERLPRDSMPTSADVETAIRDGWRKVKN